jgi:chorismate mutase
VDTRADGRQTPAEFDNLFRSDSGGAAPVTQQLPRFQPPPAQGHAQPAYAQPGYVPPAGGGHEGDGGDGGGRRRSRVPLIAAVGVGIVVIGVGAGALLSGGGGGGKSGEKNTTVSATSPATGGSSQASGADPARQQAVALDKLLADSGSSRASVIKAVAEVKACDNLDQAGSDLRSAAQQRNDLVTRLKQLPVDKLPRHGELTASLTRAWQASASADQHYAAWAGQAGGKKGCKKGHARSTGEHRAGNRESGTASAEKAKAARLWNEIAKTYGLTQRQPTQL